MSSGFTDRAAAQLKRLLAAIPIIADDAPHRIGEVARAIGTDVETLTHDLRTLVTRAGGEAPGFVEGVRLLIDANSVELRSTLSRRPMGLTRAELCAIELGLTMLRPELAPTELDALEKALKRVRQACMVARLHADEPRVRTGRLTQGSEAAALRVLRSALARCCAARIRYARPGRPCTAGGGTGASRVIHPFGLVFSRGHWFVVAHCESARALRVFRADRIVRAWLMPTKEVVQPDDFSLHRLLDDGRVLIGEVSEALVVRYSARIARWIAEREQGVKEQDGSFVVEHPLADDDWAVRHVLQYGPDAEVLAPERVRDAVRERIAAALQ